MYLVELSPGKEELYRSTDELAAAIRKGEVDAHSRIYHRATAKWISITLHPQYKAFAAEREQASARVETPAAPLPQAEWSFFNSTEALPIEPDAPAPTEEAREGADHSEGQDGHPWQRPLALAIAGAMLILGTQLAFSAPRPPWSARIPSAPVAVAEPREEVAPVPDPEEVHPVVSLASTRNWAEIGYPLPADSSAGDSALPPAAGPAVLPKAPTIRPKSLVPAALSPIGTASGAGGEHALDGLIAGYEAAYDSAQRRLESGLRVARLEQLFAPGRLEASAEPGQTRVRLAGLAGFIRTYRAQEAAIERAYQDSFVALSQRTKLGPKQIRQWYSWPSRKEGPTHVALAGGMLTVIDSIFGVLDAYAGTYRLQDGRIGFESSEAGRTYGGLRRRLGEQLDAAATARATSSGGGLLVLLEAIGATRPPPEL